MKYKICVNFHKAYNTNLSRIHFCYNRIIKFIRSYGLHVIIENTNFLHTIPSGWSETSNQALHVMKVYKNEHIIYVL